MKVESIRAWASDVPLTRPYAISGGSWDSVEMAFCELRTSDGLVGHGMASPATEVTGETRDASLRELQAAGWIVGWDPDDIGALTELERRVQGPAARAALDMALCDLVGKRARLPLVQTLGRIRTSLPTSVTIGVKPVVETLAEAREYIDRGFTTLKIKVGADLDEDLARLTMLVMELEGAIKLRVDANQGWSETQFAEFLEETEDFAFEMIEQPLPPGHEAFLRTLPRDVQRILCADESVHDEHALARMCDEGMPYGIVNVKLQKCGGPRAAMRIANACHERGLTVMWGCNDESALGIAAALHVALSCRATRYLDLDGSLDLAKDPFAGGFAIRDGEMSTLLGPGLGCELTEA